MLTELKKDSLGRKLYYTLVGYDDKNWLTLSEQEKHRYMSAAEDLYWVGRSDNR